MFHVWITEWQPRRQSEAQSNRRVMPDSANQRTTRQKSMGLRGVVSSLLLLRREKSLGECHSQAVNPSISIAFRGNSPVGRILISNHVELGYL
jgi:hypothetical protein